MSLKIKFAAIYFIFTEIDIFEKPTTAAAATQTSMLHIHLGRCRIFLSNMTKVKSILFLRNY